MILRRQAYWFGKSGQLGCGESVFSASVHLVRIRSLLFLRAESI